MMIQLKGVFDKYKINPTGVIQVGAHWAEEHDEFLRCGINKFVYIEPCQEAFKRICIKMCGVSDEGEIRNLYGTHGMGLKIGNVDVYCFACGSEDGEMPMYVSHQNQGQSNSLLKPGKHTEYHPEIIFDDAEIVKVVTLDSIMPKKQGYDFLYMDCQGYEGEVLKGATETLKHVNIIMTEVNRDSTYEGNMLVGEMDEYLKEFGFVGVEEYWPSPNWGWGDKVYLRKSFINE